MISSIANLGSSTDTDAIGESDKETAEPNKETQVEQNEKQPSFSLSTPRNSKATSAPEIVQRRKPTAQERAAAAARATDLEHDKRRKWRSRKQLKELDNDIDKNLKIARGGLLHTPAKTRKRGRPPARIRPVKNTYQDSEPEIDSHGYRPGEREAELKRLRSDKKNSQFSKKRAKFPNEEEEQMIDESGYPTKNPWKTKRPHEANLRNSSEVSDDSDSPPQSKKRRSNPITNTSSGKKNKMPTYTFTPDEPVYAPTLPPASKLTYTSTISRQPSFENSPYSSSNASQEATTSGAPHPHRSTSSHLSSTHSADHRSFFTQRLTNIMNGTGPAHYPPSFDNPRTYPIESKIASHQYIPSVTGDYTGHHDTYYTPTAQGYHNIAAQHVHDTTHMGYDSNDMIDAEVGASEELF